MVTKVRQEQVAPATTSSPPVARPFFDAKGRLLWEGSPVGQPAVEVCGETGQVLQRQVLMLAPRVDEVRCAPAGAPDGGAWLIGVGDGGKVAWRRPLGFRSGSHLLDESVIGVGRTGVVLSNLTVVSPQTGETLTPPPTREVEGEGRRVPLMSLTQAAHFLPSRGAFAVFDADVTLLRRRGGLSLLEPRTGTRQLVLPVATTLLGGYWRVEEMALAPDGRHLLLAQRLAIRGPGGVMFSVFDLEARRTVFEERFGEKRWVRQPRLVLGPRGAVGFAYVDETDGSVVLVHYQLRSSGK